MKVGLIGLGRMGRAIHARLTESGCEVTAWDRDARATKSAADAQVRLADSPRAVVASADTVISIITEDNGVKNVYRGDNGFLSGDVKGKLFIEMSTVPPEAQVALAEKVRAKGAAYVECPVGGSVVPARAGKLLGNVGGEPADVARAKPVLDQLCRRTLHAGPVGSGAVLKLAVNLPLMIYWQALGEQLAVCRDLKIDPADLLDFLSETSGAATVLKQRMPGIIHKLKNEPSDIKTFTLDNGIKDVNAMLEQGRKSGIELPLLEKALACYEEAKRNTSGDEEVSNVSAYWAMRKKK